MYVPEGWAYLKEHPEMLGWHSESIFQYHNHNWNSFINRVQNNGVLSFSPEATVNNVFPVNSHNTNMVFAYALAFVSHQRQQLSMLDWGGSIGHYFVMAQALMPDVEIDYYCKEMPGAVKYGQELLPDGHFFTDDSWCDRSYDFTLASGSLQYEENWKNVLELLAKATKGCLLINRVPVLERSESFVFLQRLTYPVKHEHLYWSINKLEFLGLAERMGLRLIREFLSGDEHTIYNAPELPTYSGFLFKKDRIGK